MLKQRLTSIFRMQRKQITKLILKKKIRDFTGMIPINEVDPQDIFTVGYPRSGNTWFQDIVSAIIHGTDPERSSFSIIHDLVPDVHFKDYYKRYRTPMFFKSHSLPKPDYRRVVYLMRDGRDAMVSYFHFLTKRRERNIDFMEMVQNGRGIPCHWHQHVEEWLANPYKAEMIVIKYENLIENPVDELRRFCDFAKINRDESYLASIIQKASFKNLRKKENTNKDTDQVSNSGTRFMRRGQIGSYKDEMPNEVLNAFMLKASKTLKKCGYIE